MHGDSECPRNGDGNGILERDGALIQRALKEIFRHSRRFRVTSREVLEKSVLIQVEDCSSRWNGHAHEVHSPIVVSVGDTIETTMQGTAKHVLEHALRHVKKTGSVEDLKDVLSALNRRAAR